MHPVGHRVRLKHGMQQCRVVLEQTFIFEQQAHPQQQLHHKYQQQCSAENAEDEAGQASDALASAKMEIQRLRAVLGTSDVAVALETATFKMSSLSEELHGAR